MEHELLEKIVLNTQKIALNTEPKDSFQILVTNNKTEFTTSFNPHISLKKNKRYEMALVNLETYYSFPNITDQNNHFTYSIDAGPDPVWYHIFVPEGSYEIDDINKFIQRKMKQNGHGKKVTISANTNTLKAVLIIENGYQVDFSQPNSLGSVLGFNNKVYASDYQESENPVNILSINSILVNVGIISGSYVNGQKTPTIYSFFPRASPGFKIIETPANLVYLPIILDQIYSMETKLTDQNGNLLNLRGENVSIRFHVREI